MTHCPHLNINDAYWVIKTGLSDHKEFKSECYYYSQSYYIDMIYIIVFYLHLDFFIFIFSFFILILVTFSIFWGGDFSFLMSAYFIAV